MALAVGCRHAAHQCHGNLRAESRGQPQRVLHAVLAALRKCEVAELGVGLAEVRDRRDETRLERFDRHDVLDPGAHGVTGEALRVRDDDLVGRIAEHIAQRVDLGRGAAPARRRVRLVRHEHRLRRDGATVDAAALGPVHEVLHHALDVVDVETRPVERAVRGRAREHLADRSDAPVARQLLPPRPQSRPRPYRGSSRAGDGRTATPRPRRARRWPRRRWRGTRRPSTPAAGRT